MSFKVGDRVRQRTLKDEFGEIIDVRAGDAGPYKVRWQRNRFTEALGCYEWWCAEEDLMPAQGAESSRAKPKGRRALVEAIVSARGRGLIQSYRIERGIRRLFRTRKPPRKHVLSKAG